MKDAEDRYVESRLDEWGSWLRGGKPKLGYSPCTLAKIMKYGAMRHDGSRAEPPINNINAEEVERLVSYYVSLDYQAAKALRLRYMADWNCTISDLARVFGLSNRQYLRCLKRAKTWLKNNIAVKKNDILTFAKAA